jgi:hypothetical protein
VKACKLHVVRDRGFERYFMDSGYFALGTQVFPTSDGGYFLLGEDGNRGVPYLFKTDDAGRVAWSKPVLSPRPSYLNSMEQTADGAYLLAGRMTAANDPNNWSDFRLLKVGISGSVEWEKSYGDGSNEDLYEIRKTADGGYIAGGGTNYYGNASIAMKLTATGDTVWVRHYDVPSSGMWYEFDNIFQASDGGYIVSGTRPSYDAAKPRDAQELYLGKLGADGSLLWVRYFGQNSTIGGEAVETDDGGFLIAGAAMAGAEADIYLVKTDKEGNKQWEKTYPRAGIQYANMLQRSRQGDYFIAGTATDSNGGNPLKFKPYLLKIDASGTELWSRIYGGGREGNLRSIHETSDGGFVAVGSSRKTVPVTSSAVFLLKADANGESR